MSGMNLIRVGQVDGSGRSDHFGTAVIESQRPLFDHPHGKSIVHMTGKGARDIGGVHQLDAFQYSRAPQFRRFSQTVRKHGRNV
jgi:hypothetical protein